MSGDRLEVIFDHAIEVSESAMATLRRDGLASRQARSESASAFLAVRRAGAATDDPGERRQLRSHATYWRSVRRVLTGRWEDAQLTPVTRNEGPSTLPDDEIIARATGDIGLNSLLVQNRQLTVQAPQFAANNCRLVGLEIDLNVESLTLPDTKLIGCRLQGQAETVMLDNAVLDGGSVSLLASRTAQARAVMTNSEATGVSISYRGSELEVTDLLARSGPVELSFDVEVATFTGCDLTEVTFRDCRARELRLVGGLLGRLQAVGCAFDSVQVDGEFVPADVRARLLKWAA